jgi:hypothetical protein
VKFCNLLFYKLLCTLAVPGIWANSFALHLLIRGFNLGGRRGGLKEGRLVILSLSELRVNGVRAN